MERDPLPEAEPWRTISDQHERLRTSLAAIYDWYERNASLAGCVLRDAEHHTLTAEIVEIRFGPYMAGYQEVLGAGLSKKQHAVLLLALSFFTWRSLVRDGDLRTPLAAQVMVRAIECAK
jgi:hypothetical protein